MNKAMPNFLDSVSMQIAELMSMAAGKISVAAVVTWIIQQSGYPETAIVSLYLLWISDFCLGFYKGVFVKRQPNMRKALYGATKIFRYYLVICLTVWLDDVFERVLPGKYIVTNFLILVMACTEMLSCITHIHDLGIYRFDEKFVASIRSYRDGAADGIYNASRNFFKKNKAPKDSEETPS